MTMSTQHEITAARHHIERLRDEHANDLTTLIHLVDGGALKGPAGDTLTADLHTWDRGYKDLFTRALRLLDALHPSEPAS
ncbi:hypothetical protein [Nonomuraea sp. NPDC052265]|uniref:hypothetical protein n=1 Tax=Nonomuraea sp. NPDC052265 TaxID=3364374 RepID=UPI0037CB9651